VVGIGSSGAYVIANLERVLYEVLGNAAVDVFRLISIDTDNTRKEDEPPPGGKRGTSLSAYERDLGKALYNLKLVLGDDFSWCPPGLKIQGQGAGNIRAGGRVMFFNKFSEIWEALRNATADVRAAARRPQSEQNLMTELRRRGLNPQQGIVDPGTEAVYVVGTLAGGTGSGMCVDMGYAIHDAAPTALRFGIFFLADRANNPVYVQNTWAALKDLEYFCDHPSAFRAVWPRSGTTTAYQADGVAPYDYIYLITQQDGHRGLVLRYEPNWNSPLVAMTAMHLAADLLGLNQQRSAALVNRNRVVPGPEKNRLFLNLCLRGVSYPKYEISESAACTLISDAICHNWLDQAYHETAGGKSAIKEDDIKKAGRDRWNQGLEQVWIGTRGSVNLKEWADKLCDGHLARPLDDLCHQFAAPVTGTVFSQIQQQIPNRVTELKKMIKGGLAQRFEQDQNLKVATLFLGGVREGVQKTLRYWDLLRIPAKQDEEAWSGVSRGLVEQMLRQRSALSVKALKAHREFVLDQLQEISLRLQMYVMRSALNLTLEWIDTHMARWIEQLRSTIESVNAAATTRYSTLLAQLSNEQPPILKLSRIKAASGDRAEGFRAEIANLVRTRPDPGVPLLRLSAGDEFEGLFAVPADQQARNDSRPQEIFLELKNLLQAKLLLTLEEAGPVDVAAEIVAQGRTPQAAIFMQDAASLSIATKTQLPTAGMPSLIVAKDINTASSLLASLHQVNTGLPNMNPSGLPMLDHMVLFYQEAAGAVPDDLTDARSFRQEYDNRLKSELPEYIDPLRNLKKTSDGAAS
jgi:hypothetical protein